MLCETWVTKDTKKFINIPGYDYIGIECDNKKGGGVGLLVANEIKYKIKDDLNKMTDHKESFVIEIFTKGKNVLCGSVYHPPNTNIKAFHSDMNKLMEQIKLESRKDSIISMDHNLDFIKHSLHKDTKNLLV